VSGELILSALRHAVAALHRRGVPAAVMGGLAIAHWGHARFTRDVDLLLAAEPSVGDDLTRFLAGEGFFPRRVPPVARVGDHSFIQLLFSPPGRLEDSAVDLLFADSPFLRSASGRSVPYSGDDQIRVVSCEDLILLKLQADRVIDRMDAAYLLQYNRESLDLAYLNQWVAALGLAREWSDAWRQAFPGEEPPAVSAND
jgi:hypothetical protein